MSTRELKRVHIIQQIAGHKLRQRQASEFLDLSIRQVKRLLRRFRQTGPKGLVHRLRSRPSNRKLPEKLREKVLGLYEKTYRGFGPTLAQEKLWERNRIRVSRETLRQWLLEARLWERKKRKTETPHLWRERKPCLGEMIQMDGSHHDWLEGRGPKLVLMGLIDDATSNVFARFYDYEGTLPAMESFHGYLTRYGLPQSVYLDKHSTYRGFGKPTLEEELQGKTRTPSQFERALTELGVQVIHADSAPAKGRIERLFGTFQDRLVKEMRLEGIKTKDEANRFLIRYLPKYNRKFHREPRREVNLHRPVPQGLNLKRILSIHKRRRLRSDQTICHEGKLYLVGEQRWKGNRPKWIEIERHLEGQLHFFTQNQELAYRQIHEAPRRSSLPKRKSKPPLPSPNHSWKRFRLPGSHSQGGFVYEFQDRESVASQT